MADLKAMLDRPPAPGDGELEAAVLVTRYLSLLEADAGTADFKCLLLGIALHERYPEQAAKLARTAPADQAAMIGDLASRLANRIIG